MLYVKYDLKWGGKDNEIGEQPYIDVKENGADFDGGVFRDDGVYFGYIHGKDEDCRKAIQACVGDFKMEEVDQASALALFAKAYPEGREVTDDSSKVGEEEPKKYLDKPIVKPDGKIEVPTTDVKKELINEK
jgi:hypothetical protein